MIPRRLVWFLLLMLFTSVPSVAGERPSVLFLFADDMRADAIAAHGNPSIRTPHLDALAESGFSFRGNYIFGGNSGAVCVPSRAMLMSGKTWFRVDTATLKETRLLPELLGEHGYATFGTGKWHNGQAAWLRAFQRGKNIMFGGMSDHTKVPIRDLSPEGRLTAERTGEKFSSELFADAAIDFLSDVKLRQPFFAYVAFTAPHDPRQPPPGMRGLYYRNTPPLPANFLPQHPFDNGMMQGGRDENLGAWPRTEAMIRDQLAEYYGLITHMDEQIGRILTALRRSPAGGNTLVIFASDNGLALGSHGLLGKQNVFEHSMRVPLILSGPGIPRGESTAAFTYLHDLFPTLCDLLAIPGPEDLEGHSLRPLWERRKARVRDSVFLPFLDIQRAVRDDRWKLIAYPKLGHLQLFDLLADPHERVNLIDRPEHGGRVTQLLGLMKQWQAEVGDTVKIPAGNRAPPNIDLTGRRRAPDQWQPAWIVHKYFDPPPVTRIAGLEVTELGTQFTPDPRRVLLQQTRADMGGNTSVRKTDAGHLEWKSQGYFQRNRDLGQVFTPERDFVLESIVLRTGPAHGAVLAGAPGAKVFLQFFEVVGDPVIHDNGTPPGAEARHGFSTNHRCDDYLTGIEYRPLRVVSGGRFPDLPPTRDRRGEPNGRSDGCLVYLRWALAPEARLELKAGRRYAFVVGFEEPGPERGFTLANANSAGVDAAPSLTDSHDRYHGGWGVRREGDGTLPPTLCPAPTPPQDAFISARLRREALFAEGDARYTLQPTTDGFPDVDTYRDLEFYLETGSSAMHAGTPGSGGS
jgi:arylsulfatase A-like enzyme